MAIDENFRSEEGFVVGNNDFVANTTFLSGIIPITTIFTSNGTYTKNANLLYSDVIVIGGGGSSISVEESHGSCGAGAGATVEARITTINLRSGGEPVVIGIAIANNSGTNSSFGNNTSSFTPLVAVGGKFANGIGGLNPNNNIGVGGTGIGGDIIIPGGDGDGTFWFISSNTNNACMGGKGGNSRYGFGGQTLLSTGETIGNPGTGYGAGGGGAANFSGGGTANGGIGANGAVIVIEYCHI